MHAGTVSLTLCEWAAGLPGGALGCGAAGLRRRRRREAALRVRAAVGSGRADGRLRARRGWPEPGFVEHGADRGGAWIERPVQLIIGECVFADASNGLAAYKPPKRSTPLRCASSMVAMAAPPRFDGWTAGLCWVQEPFWSCEGPQADGTGVGSQVHVSSVHTRYCHATQPRSVGKTREKKNTEKQVTDEKNLLGRTPVEPVAMSAPLPQAAI